MHYGSSFILNPHFDEIPLQGSEDADLERIDLDALKRLETPRKVNPLQPHRDEEDLNKTADKWEDKN